MVGAGPLTHAARPPTLTPAQRDAVRHVRAVALRERPTALAVIGRTLAGTGVRHDVAQLVGPVGRAGRLTLNFHPDRCRHGPTVAEALATEGATADVAELVVDPSFRDTDTGTLLAATARRYGFPLRWHAGFALPVSQVDAEFRGPAIPLLAARVHAEFARPGEPLHAALIGRAAASVVTDPGRWTVDTLHSSSGTSWSASVPRTAADPAGAVGFLAASSGPPAWSGPIRYHAVTLIRFVTDRRRLSGLPSEPGRSRRP